MSLFSFFLGIQFDSSVPQTKMVSAVEPAPANDERMQGTLSHTCPLTGSSWSRREELYTVCCDLYWSTVVIVDVSYAWFCCFCFQVLKLIIRNRQK